MKIFLAILGGIIIIFSVIELFGGVSGNDIAHLLTGIAITVFALFIYKPKKKEG